MTHPSSEGLRSTGRVRATRGPPFRSRTGVRETGVTVHEGDTLEGAKDNWIKCVPSTEYYTHSLSSKFNHV